MSIVFLLLSKSCEVRYVVENRRKIKLSKSSSHRFDGSMATVRVLHSDQSARYSTFFIVSGEKSGIAS